MFIIAEYSYQRYEGNNSKTTKIIQRNQQMENFIIMPTDQLKNLVKEAVQEVTAEKEKGVVKLYSINEVSKMLGRAHKTITSLVNRGVIKATPDHMISEESINKYLQNK